MYYVNELFHHILLFAFFFKANRKKTLELDFSVVQLIMINLKIHNGKYKTLKFKTLFLIWACLLYIICTCEYIYIHSHTQTAYYSILNTAE